MKKSIIVIIAAILVTMIISFKTNPSVSEYQEWFRTYTLDKIGSNNKITDGFLGYFADVLSSETKVSNYKLFSIYQLYDNEGYELEVLGIFNKFIVLNENEITAESEK